jgi:stage V sporulation protein G
MEITEVRISLSENVQTRLKAYASVTFDRCFVVRNMKIIEGKNGLFVAMPSRKPKILCGTCQSKNDLGSRFCSQCGAGVARQSSQIPGAGDLEAPEGLSHRDIVHPITAEFRQYLQKVVLDAYDAERNASGLQTQAVGESERT